MKMHINIRSFKGILPGIALAAGAFSAQAQMVAEDVFLKGKFVEVGICDIGAFGSIGPAPDGYHATMFDGTLGFIADPDLDGWDVGSPPLIGDYFLPGSPQEGWDIQVGGVRSEAWRGNFPYGTFTGDLDGSNTGYVVDGSKVIGNWQGTAGNLAITQKTVLDTNKVYFVCEVVLKNTGSTTINDIYYDRTVDPDNEVNQGGSFTTANTIVYQPDASGEGDQKCLVSAEGTSFDSYLGLGAVDCRAKCYIIRFDGLQPQQPLDDIYDDDTEYLTEKDDTYTDDVGIGIVWKIGDLAPGDSTTLAYAYILRQADLDSAFATLKPNWSYEGSPLENNDTIVKCWGAEMNVEIAGGGAYVWGDWYPSTGLSETSGRRNTITVGHEVVTYRVIGTTPICPKSDTLYLTIVPEGDSVIINKSICQGETYDFLGNLKYQSGTYYDVLSTSTGCDSVLQLNLTVNPLPDVTISARETQICEGEEALFTLDNPSPGTTYQWKRDGANIPGATQHTYAAPSVPGVYSISGVTSKGCTDDSRTITLTVNPKAEGSIVSISEQDVCIGDTVTLTSDGKPGYQYTWEPEAYFRYTSGNMNPSASGVIPGTTEVRLVSMNEYGCKDYDTAVVTAHPCCDIYIPTAFSPNNDGRNDEFAPKLRPGQKIIALQIFNRKGQLVYDNDNPQKGWNGKYNNTDAEAAQDVYMYRFVYTCTDGEVFETKGDITLIR